MPNRVAKCGAGTRHKWEKHATAREGEMFESIRCVHCKTVLRFRIGPRGGCKEVYESPTTDKPRP